MKNDILLTRNDLKVAFESAQGSAPGYLFHTRKNAYNGNYFCGPTFDCWNVVEDTLVVKDDSFMPLVEYFHCADTPRIGGIYDLSKPFESSSVSLDAIPADLVRDLSKIAARKDDDYKGPSLWEGIKACFGYEQPATLPTFNSLKGHGASSEPAVSPMF